MLMLHRIFVPMRHRIAAIAIGMILAAALSGTARAECEAGNGVYDHQLPAANQLVANSESATLRGLYADNKCRIRAILHQSGSACINGKGNNHVTVDGLNAPGGAKQGGSYHVFDYTAADSTYQCTTR